MSQTGVLPRSANSWVPLARTPKNRYSTFAVVLGISIYVLTLTQAVDS